MANQRTDIPTKLYVAGVEVVGGGVIATGGVATRIPVFSGASAVDGYADFLWDETNKNLLAGNGFTITAGNHHNIVAGLQHSIDASSHYNAVFGAQVTVITGSANMVTAALASVTGSLNIVNGQSVNVTGNCNVVNGSLLTVFNSLNPSFIHGCLVVGDQMTVTGINCAVVGRYHTVGGGWSGVFGETNRSTSTHQLITGKDAFANLIGQHTQASGMFAVQGDAQTSRLTVRKQTLNDTQTELAVDGGTNYISSLPNKAYAFEATVVAKQVGSMNHAMYKLTWIEAIGASGASLVVNGLVKTIIYESDISWDVDVLADTGVGNPRSRIMVTGVAATTINWLAKVEMTEVTA